VGSLCLSSQALIDNVSLDLLHQVHASVPVFRFFLLSSFLGSSASSARS
jgi:hypothetical protein